MSDRIYRRRVSGQQTETWEEEYVSVRYVRQRVAVEEYIEN